MWFRLAFLSCPKHNFVEVQKVHNAGKNASCLRLMKRLRVRRSEYGTLNDKLALPDGIHQARAGFFVSIDIVNGNEVLLLVFVGDFARPHDFS